VEVVASLSQGRTAAAQCGLFTHKLVPVIFEPPCMSTPLHCTGMHPAWHCSDAVIFSTIQLCTPLLEVKNAVKEN